jgi:hypothetical protein
MKKEEFRKRPEVSVSKAIYRKAWDNELKSISLPFNGYWARMLPPKAFRIEDNKLLFPATEIPKTIILRLSGTNERIEKPVRIIMATSDGESKTITIYFKKDDKQHLSQGEDSQKES